MRGTSQSFSAGPDSLFVTVPKLSQIVAAAFGVFLISIAAVGFSVTGLDHFSGNVGHEFLGVSVNPLANVVYLALGIYALVAATRRSTALVCTRVMFLANLLLFLYGVYALNNPDKSVFAVNGHTNGMYLLLALLARW